MIKLNSLKKCRLKKHTAAVHFYRNTGRNVLQNMQKKSVIPQRDPHMKVIICAGPVYHLSFFSIGMK